MKTLACAFAALLTACQPSEPPERAAALKAEQHFQFLKAQHAMPGELCAAARETRDAWSRALDKNKYAVWDIETFTQCGGP